MQKGLRLSLLLLALSTTGFGNGRIINGIVVPKSKFAEITQAKTDQGGTCTATLVGPKVVLLAAHCAQDGANATLQFRGKSYEGKVQRSHLYPSEDHDIAAVILERKVRGVRPATVGGALATGQTVSMFGFGCTAIGGGGASDTLRMGQTVVTSFLKHDAVTKMPNGAALCFGDSGGPATTMSENHLFVSGIASKGNLSDTSYFARLDTESSKTFLNSLIEEHEVTICGINTDC